MNEYPEDTLVEQPTIELFSELEYETANCFYEKIGTSGSTLGRETTAEVILLPKLRSALWKLNPIWTAMPLALPLKHSPVIEVR